MTPAEGFKNVLILLPVAPPVPDRAIRSKFVFRACAMARCTHLRGVYDELNEEDSLKYRRRLTVYRRRDLDYDEIPITSWQSLRVDVFERREVLAWNQLRKFKC